jgi:hypothetical protein
VEVAHPSLVLRVFILTAPVIHNKNQNKTKLNGGLREEIKYFPKNQVINSTTILVSYCHFKPSSNQSECKRN